MRLDEFEWDDGNESKIECRLGVRSVDSLLDVEVLVLRSKGQPGRPQRYRLVGRDYSGRWITVIAQPLARPAGAWRPVTGWQSTAAERNAARKAGVR